MGEINEKKGDIISNKEKTKHWVKACDLHHKINEAFDHETSAAIASTDFAADEQERECFNEFSVDLCVVQKEGCELFKKNNAADVQNAVKWNVERRKAMKKWSIKEKNHAGKNLNADALKILHCLPIEKECFFEM